MKNLEFRISFLLLALALGLYFITSPSVILAHFVKSDAGIGAVLHVDPGDDPVAGESSSIILEFKDTNNRFDLNKCDCRLVVTKDGQEILSEMIHPVEPDQKLSSVNQVVFSEKNIYKLKITGTALHGEFADFELNYDVRVAKEQEATAGMVHDKEEGGWLEKNIIFIVGGGLIGALLLGAFFNKQSLRAAALKKKKIAVIILVLLILGHSLPIKAIHASHSGVIQSENFTCCLPAAALIPEFPEIVIVEEFSDIEPLLDDRSTFQELSLKYFIRPPPLS